VPAIAAVVIVATTAGTEGEDCHNDGQQHHPFCFYSFHMSNIY
jgi:hypothetical protein